MSDMSEEERRAAEERIRRIREGSGQPASSSQPSGEVEPGLNDSSDALSQARSRVQAARESLEVAEKQTRGGSRGSRRAQPSVAAGKRSLQGMIVIGGVVVIGLLIVAIIIMLGNLLGGSGSPLGATATPEPSPTLLVTETPPPTEGPAASGSSAGDEFELALPPLTCIFQSGVGCYDYCQDPANEAECDSARQFVRAQNADPDVWLNCVAPEPGPNVGNPQECLEEAWRANNP